MAYAVKCPIGRELQGFALRCGNITITHAAGVQFTRAVASNSRVFHAIYENQRFSIHAFYFSLYIVGKISQLGLPPLTPSTITKYGFAPYLPPTNCIFFTSILLCLNV